MATIVDTGLGLLSDSVVLLVVLGVAVKETPDDEDGGISVGADVLLVLVAFVSKTVADLLVLTSSGADSVMLSVVVLGILEYNVTMSSVVGVVLLFVMLGAVFAEADTIVLLPACVNLLLLVFASCCSSKHCGPWVSVHI